MLNFASGKQTVGRKFDKNYQAQFCHSKFPLFFPTKYKISPQRGIKISPHQNNFTPQRKISPLKSHFYTCKAARYHIYFISIFIVRFFVSQNFQKQIEQLKFTEK